MSVSSFFVLADVGSCIPYVSDALINKMESKAIHIISSFFKQLFSISQPLAKCCTFYYLSLLFSWLPFFWASELRVYPTPSCNPNVFFIVTPLLYPPYEWKMLTTILNYSSFLLVNYEHLGLLHFYTILWLKLLQERNTKTFWALKLLSSFGTQSSFFEVEINVFLSDFH